MPPLTADHVIAEGGWHPRYARVLAVATDGRFGVAVVDGNGDLSELETETWLFDGTCWQPDSSSGGVGSGSGFGSFHEDGERAFFSTGRSRDGEAVDLEVGGAIHRVEIGQLGYWAFVSVAART